MTDAKDEDARMVPRCEPPEGWEFHHAVAKAIHEGMGQGWAYTNYGGDEWNSCRGMLDSAADEVLKIVTPPSVVQGLVEALEAAKAWVDEEEEEKNNWSMEGRMAFLRVQTKIREALAAYRASVGDGA